MIIYYFINKYVISLPFFIIIGCKTALKQEISIQQSKEGLITQTSIDSVSLTEIKRYSPQEYPTIFGYYKHENIDEVEVWSNKLFGRCCSNTDITFAENLFFKISSNFRNVNYPIENVSDTQYLTAFAFKTNADVKINLQLDLSSSKSYLKGKYSNKNLLKSNDTIMNPIKLSIINGYVKSEMLFYENARVKQMQVFLNNQYIETIILNDTPFVQEFSVNSIFKTNDIITLQPATFYKGSKYDDVCISEIQTNLGETALSSLNKKFNLMELNNKD